MSPSGTSSVVIEDLVFQRGSSAILGRYHAKRTLQADFKLKTVLGEGASGFVRLARDADGREFAVKTLHKEEEKTGSAHEPTVEAEVKIHLTLDHPHIVRLEQVYETEDDLSLVIEHMAGGDLYSRWKQIRKFPEREAAACISQILLGVSYLHAQGVVHRDLKMENVMYKDAACTYLKIIDVGLATRWDRVHNITHACGTPCYLAPEAWRRSYTDKADMWAVGLMAFELLTGQSPFQARSKKDKLRMIQRGQVTYSISFRMLSAGAQSFVKSLLSVDPASRLSAVEALQHEWIRGFHHPDAAPEIGILQGFSDLAQASSCKRMCFSMVASEIPLGEQRELQRQFHAIDEDMSGTIELREFCGAMKQVGMDEQEAENIFHQVTSNRKTNDISYSDFLAASLQRCVDVPSDACKHVFNRFDEDSNGVINAEDCISIASTTISGIDDLIREADANSDGELCFDEFVSYLQHSRQRIPQLAHTFAGSQQTRKGCERHDGKVRAQASCTSCWSWLWR